MACYYPLDAWKAASVNPSGKRGVVFSLRDGLVDQPLQVPCGKCIGCRADQSLMWSIRAYHESTLHDKTCFVTLTYDDAHLPADGKISKHDLQCFFKRLRKDYPPRQIRYIACGEYGEQTRRPHYHAILYGEDFLHDKISISDDLYTSPTLLRYWKAGHVTIAPVTLASIMYVCGYVNKKIGDEDTFSLMSRRPGIGHDWLKKYKDDLRRTGTVTIEGREFPVPPRYLVWEEDHLGPVKEKRRQYAAAIKRDGIDRRNMELNRKALLSRKQEKL